MTIELWTYLILFYVVSTLIEYGIGRVLFRLHEGTWKRECDHWLYWLVGCIFFNVVGWGLYGIIRLIQWM